MLLTELVKNWQDTVSSPLVQCSTLTILTWRRITLHDVVPTESIHLCSPHHFKFNLIKNFESINLAPFDLIWWTCFNVLWRSATTKMVTKPKQIRRATQFVILDLSQAKEERQILSGFCVWMLCALFVPIPHSLAMSNEQWGSNLSEMMPHLIIQVTSWWRTCANAVSWKASRMDIWQHHPKKHEVQTVVPIVWPLHVGKLTGLMTWHCCTCNQVATSSLIACMMHAMLIQQLLVLHDGMQFAKQSMMMNDVVMKWIMMKCEDDEWNDAFLHGTRWVCVCGSGVQQGGPLHPMSCRAWQVCNTHSGFFVNTSAMLCAPGMWCRTTRPRSTQCWTANQQMSMWRVRLVGW